jgi:integrase
LAFGSLGLSTRIVPHQFRHTYATEMLRSGVSFPVLMKLLGHVNPEVTIRFGQSDDIIVVAITRTASAAINAAA